MEPALIIGAVVVVVAVLIGTAAYLDKKRREALEALAASMNLTFSRKADPGLLASLKNFHLFSQGHARKIYNIMQGANQGTDLKVFDYTYTVGSGKNQSTYRQTVVMFESSDLALPLFSLRPEHVFHKIGSAFGYQDIDIPGRPDFSGKYLLRGPDETAIAATFTEPIVSHYEAHKGLSTEGCGNRLAYFRHSKTVKAEQMQAFMGEAFAVFALFKRGP